MGKGSRDWQGKRLHRLAGGKRPQGLAGGKGQKGLEGGKRLQGPAGGKIPEKSQMGKGTRYFRWERSSTSRREMTS